MGRDLSSSKTGASRQSRFDRITVVRNLRTEIKFRFTENEAARSLSPYLSGWYIHRIWTTTHAFPFPLLECLPFEIIAFPFSRLSFPFPSTFVNLGCWGEGLKRQISRRHANDSLPLPKERFNIRATSRDSPLWPGSFWNLAKTVSTIFALLRFLFHPCFTKKWMETVVWKFVRAAEESRLLLSHGTYIPLILAEIEVGQSSPANPGTTLTEACDHLPPPLSDRCRD